MACAWHVQNNPMLIERSLGALIGGLAFCNCFLLEARRAAAPERAHPVHVRTRASLTCMARAWHVYGMCAQALELLALADAGTNRAAARLMRERGAPDAEARRYAPIACGARPDCPDCMLIRPGLP